MNFENIRKDCEVYARALGNLANHIAKSCEENNWREKLELNELSIVQGVYSTMLWQHLYLWQTCFTFDENPKLETDTDFLKAVSIPLEAVEKNFKERYNLKLVLDQTQVEEVFVKHYKDALEVYTKENQ